METARRQNVLGLLDSVPKIRGRDDYQTSADHIEPSVLVPANLRMDRLFRAKLHAHARPRQAVALRVLLGLHRLHRPAGDQRAAAGLSTAMEPAGGEEGARCGPPVAACLDRRYQAVPRSVVPLLRRLPA